MKNNWLLVSLYVGCSLAWPGYSQNDDPELMKINGKSIKRSEFEYIYNKNNQQQIDNKSLDEYVTLFKNYKLKVAEAEANGIDTTKAFINELAGYRTQLAQPYLVDSRVDDRLAREAYDRLKENVEVSHILFKVSPGASSEEREKVYKKALSVLERIRKGEDFTKLAKQYSEDPSVVNNGGYLGYITGFMTVYPFETAAYNTPVGSVSEPVLTSFGYHLIKVSNRRPDRGEVLTSHIMIMVPANSSNEIKKEKELKAKEIYQEVLQGGDFAKIAKEKSEDKASGQRGGELPWFGTGRIVKEYEDAAFALKNKGDISEPVLSPYGWHIIKLLDHRSIKSFEDMKPNIMRRISQDERGNQGQKALIEKLKVDYGYSLNAVEKTKLEQFAKTMFPADSMFIATVKNNQAPLFSLAGNDYPVSGFADYMKKMRRGNASIDAVTYLNDKLSDYIDSQILKYEDSQLESKYADFRNLMNEYRDGMLLFEISNREVWDKAAKDEDGLAKYFNENKKAYAWDKPHYKGYAVSCIDKDVAKAVKKRIKSLPADSVVFYINKEFNNDSITSVKIEKGLYVQGDNNIVDKLIFKDKNVTIDEKLPVIFVSGKKLKKTPECFTDVRGQVTADYQNYLEKLWVDNLNRKYPVEIHEDVLKTVNKH